MELEPVGLRPELVFSTFSFYPNLKTATETDRVRQVALSKYHHCQEIKFQIVQNKVAGDELKCEFYIGHTDFSQELLKTHFNEKCYIPFRLLHKKTAPIPQFSSKSHCHHRALRRKLKFFCTLDEHGCRKSSENGLSVRVETTAQQCTCDASKWKITYEQEKYQAECTQIELTNEKTKEVERLKLVPEGREFRLMNELTVQLQADWTNVNVGVNVTSCVTRKCVGSRSVTPSYKLLTINYPGGAAQKDLRPINSTQDGQGKTCPTVSIDKCITDSQQCAKKTITATYYWKKQTFENGRHNGNIWFVLLIETLLLFRLYPDWK